MCTAVSVPELAAINPSAVTPTFFTDTTASILAKGLMRLRTAERLMLSLTYFHEFSIGDAAEVMKLDLASASALHTGAVISLSKLVAGKNEQFC